MTGPPLVTLWPHGDWEQPELQAASRRGLAEHAWGPPDLHPLCSQPALFCWRVVRGACVYRLLALQVTFASLHQHHQHRQRTPMPCSTLATRKDTRKGGCCSQSCQRQAPEQRRKGTSSHLQSGSSTGGHPTSRSRQVTSGYRSRDYCPAFPYCPGQRECQDPWKVREAATTSPAPVPACQDTRCQLGCSPPAPCPFLPPGQHQVWPRRGLQR